MEYLWEALNTMSRAYQHDQFVWNVLIAVLLIALLGLFPWKKLKKESTLAEWFDFLPRRKGRAMRRARRDYIRSDTIDALVDHIEKRVAQGDYTRKEAKELYREARKAWEVKDLFPNPQLLKENIKKRMANQVNVPVPLPGKEETPKRKHLFDKPVKA